MDDGLVQYLIDVLKRMDRKEFFKLSQITTKLDLDPEEFLYWLGRRETYADEEEQGCAAAMDHALLRRQKDLRDLSLRGTGAYARTHRHLRVVREKLSGSGLSHPTHYAPERRTISQLR